MKKPTNPDDEHRWDLLHKQPDWQGPGIGAVKGEWRRHGPIAFAAALHLDHIRQTKPELSLGLYSFIVLCYKGECRRPRHRDIHGTTLANLDRARRVDEQDARWQQARRDVYQKEMPAPPLTVALIPTPALPDSTTHDTLRQVAARLGQGDQPRWLRDLTERLLQ